MNEESLTKKYAPVKLKDIIGQEHVTSYFRSVLQRPEQAHKNYVILGSFGTGKTLTARCFANELIGVPDARETPNYLEIDSSDQEIIKNFNSFRDYVFQEVPGYKVIVLDECLGGDTRILLSDGRKVPIRDLWAQQYEGCVPSFNEKTMEIEDKPVVKVHKNSRKNIFRVETRYRGVVWASSSHKFASVGGWRSLDALKLGDCLFRKSRVLTVQQREIILGSLLGDSGFLFTKGATHVKNGGSPRMYLMQSDKQESWLDLKLSKVKSVFSGKKQKNKNMGWGNYNFRVCSQVHPCVAEYVKLCMKDGRRVVTQEWLDQLTPLSIMTWFYDDGSHSVNRYKRKNGDCVERTGSASFSTHGFTEEENHLIAAYFKDKWNISFHVYEDKRGKGFYLSVKEIQDTHKLMELIAPWAPVGVLEYKLGPDYVPGGGIDRVSDQLKEGLVEDEIVDIKLVSKNEVTYDLTVEDNHNYFANGLLVHNCHLLGKEHQQKFLKPLEDFVGRFFFFFVSTEENGIMPTIMSRSLVFNMGTFSELALEKHANEILKKEGVVFKEDTVRHIVFSSQGHMRNLLNQIEICIFQGEEYYVNQFRAIDNAVDSYFRSTSLDVIQELVKIPFEILKRSIEYYILNVIIKDKQVFKSNDIPKMFLFYLKLKRYIQTENDFYSFLYAFKEYTATLGRIL